MLNDACKCWGKTLSTDAAQSTANWGYTRTALLAHRHAGDCGEWRNADLTEGGENNCKNTFQCQAKHLGHSLPVYFCSRKPFRFRRTRRLGILNPQRSR